MLGFFFNFGIVFLSRASPSHSDIFPCCRTVLLGTYAEVSTLTVRRSQRLLSKQENLAQQIAAAVQNVTESEEQLGLIEQEEANNRKEKFCRDLDDKCVICQQDFLTTAGLPSFSLVTVHCNRCDNDRMLHLRCWGSMPRKMCVICRDPVQLVDEEGNVLTVTVETQSARSAVASA